ncbi:MAG: PKD domain-containing protein [Deltaproteobacteria bacterium]|nr:PKD domain-containing protein [Deltaproteobacteria bacterium]
MGSRYTSSVLSLFLLLSITITAKAEVINGTDQSNYTLLLGPNTYRSPLVGTKTTTESLSASPAPQEAQLYVVNGSGEDLSLSNCSGLPLLRKIACVISNGAKIVRLNLERPKQIEISLNGQVIVTQNSLTSTTNSLLLPITLSSENQLRIKLKGSVFSFVQVSIRGLDHVSPVINLASPTENQVIEGLSFGVLATSNERLHSASLSISGEGTFPLSLSSDGLTITGEITSSSPGPKVLTLTTRDPAGNETVIQRSIRLNFNRPPTANLVLASSGTGNAPLIVLFDASQSSDPDNDQLQYRFDFDEGTVFTGTNPKVSHEFLNPGNFDVEVRVTDPSGLASIATIAVSVISPTLPPDPVQVAPPLSQSSVQPFSETVEFLYSGANPIQRDVQINAVREDLIATVSGIVLDQDGEPLSGVKVSSVGKPELGYTLSREDGKFDIAIHSGGMTTLKFERNGYAHASRDLDAKTQSMFALDSVLLVKRDTKVTTVAVNAPFAQLAEGSPVVDDRGTRTATVLVPQNTAAHLKMPSGANIAVENLNIRMTEFTVGPNGPKKMPASLPLQTAYTYALEITTDEAIALGAEQVVFSKPVSFYVDNFLSIPSGLAMPLGYLNPKTGYWEAYPDGVVIDILSHDNGRAVLNLGSGQGATAEELAIHEIDDTELEKLATLYQPGRSIWRVRLNHFSINDLNGNGQSPKTNDPSDPNNNNVNSPINCPGCVIDVVSGNVTEKIELPGTERSIHFSSRRGGSRAENARATIQYLGEEIPSNLRVELSYSIAGKRIDVPAPSVPNGTAEIVWDGYDLWGRQVFTEQEAQISITYIQSSFYSFRPYNPDDPTTWASPRERNPELSGGLEYFELEPYTAQTTYRKSVSLRPPLDLATKWAVKSLGKWTLDNHHFLNTNSFALYKGNGDVSYLNSRPKIVRSIAGNGPGFAGDDGPATAAQFNGIRNLTFDNEGNILVADIQNHRIRKIDKLTGIVTTIAGNGSSAYSGDGGPAISAGLALPVDLTVDRDGNIYFSDFDVHRVRRIDKLTGIITTIAGTGVAGYSGDGGLAVNAQINGPRSVIANPDGSIFVSEEFNHVIRRIDPSGIIRTFAGTGTAGYSGDGGPAIDAEFSFPNYTARDSVGNLYVAQAGTRCAIRKISPTGHTVTTIAGTGTCANGLDGEPANLVPIGSVAAVAVSNDRRVYFADRTFHRIKMVDELGNLQTVIGTGFSGFNGLGRTGAVTNLGQPTDVEVRPDGSLVFIEFFRHAIREFVNAPAIVQAQNGTLELANEDSTEIFVFDQSGKHLRTLFAETRTVKYSFEYEGDRLIATIDSDGNRTSITRNGSGEPSAIVSPYGQTFSLVIDGSAESERLSRITYPTGESYQVEYDSFGMMTKFVKPRGGEYTFTYNLRNRLIGETDPAGGSQTIGSTYRSTAEGNLFTWGYQQARTGSTYSTTYKGDETSRSASYDSGLSSIANPNLVLSNSIATPDPRLLGISSYTAYEEQFRPGQPWRILNQTTKTYVSNQTSFVRTDRTQTDYGFFQTVFDSSTRTYSSTTSEGRFSQTVIDSKTRPIRLQTGTLTPTEMTYDTRGRLSEITRGNRSTKFRYDTNGFLLETEDALGQITRTSSDATGKIVSSTNPNLETVGFSYDLDRNLSEIVLPGNLLHRLASNFMDNFGGYLTPLGRELNHQYTRDQELSLVTRADGKQIRYNYTQDAKRKLLSIETDAQTISFSYVPFRALLQGITTNDGYTAFDYDGDAPISKNYFGVFNNGITMTYYQNGRLLNSMTVGGSYIAIAYNSDQEPSAVGELGITREQQTGLLTTKNLSSITENFGYNTFGELESKSLNGLGGETYQRDNLGRITQKTTTLGGQNETSSYTYDPAGRLARVVRSGTYASDVRYTYDARGNRIAVNRDGSITSGSYDTEDRLLSYGDLRFTYTDHGDLLEKENIVSGQKITLTYDQRGQLTRAQLSGGRVITYTIDGEGRRLSRFVDGVFNTGYMHDISGRLVAEVEPSGQLRSHFVYATESHSPDYMITSGAKFYFAKDQLGSIRAVINVDTGVVAQAIHYDEFGRILADSNPGFQPFGFAGGHFDHDTGLVRFGARDYDSEVGRWLSKDPILFQGGRNHYSYVSSDPINFLDPTGLSQQQVDCAVTWLRINRPELFIGLPRDLSIRDGDLSLYRKLSEVLNLDPSVGARYNRLTKNILIDTTYFNSMNAPFASIVGAVAHELMHAQDSYFNQRSHRVIDQTESNVVREYIRNPRGGK